MISFFLWCLSHFTSFFPPSLVEIGLLDFWAGFWLVISNMQEFLYVCIHPCVEKGSNLIFQYQFMARPLIPLRTSESLRIFSMGNITVYLAHAVAPRRLHILFPWYRVLVNFLMLFPFGKKSLVYQVSQHRLIHFIGAHQNGRSFLYSLYHLPSDCCSCAWISHIYACMILSPLSVYACSLSDIPTGHLESWSSQGISW